MVEAYKIPYKGSQLDFIEIMQPIDPPSEKIMLHAICVLKPWAN
jgi:hypothetical protein